MAVLRFFKISILKVCATMLVVCAVFLMPFAPAFAVSGEDGDDVPHKDACKNVLLLVQPQNIRDATLVLWAGNPDPIRGDQRLSGATLAKIVEDLMFPGSVSSEDRHHFEILMRVIKHPNVSEKGLINILTYLENSNQRRRFELGAQSDETLKIAAQLSRHPVMGEKLLSDLIKTMYRAANGTPFAEALLSDELINHPKLTPEQFILLTDHVLVPVSFTNEAHFLELLLDRALSLPVKDAQTLLMRIEDFGKRVMLNKSQTFTERNRFNFANKLLEKAPISQDLAHQMVLVERKWLENAGKQYLTASELVDFSKRLHSHILTLNVEKLSALSLSVVAKYEKLGTM